MKRETGIWTAIILVGVVLLGIRILFFTGEVPGKEYVKVVPNQLVNVGSAGDPKWVKFGADELNESAFAGQAFEAIPDELTREWNTYDPAMVRDYLEADAADPDQTTYAFSFWRTVGVWVAGLFTLAIFSFLYRDNPFYKIAESVVVGVSAAFWMVVGFWEVIVPNLIGKLSPDLVKGWAMPGLKEHRDLWYVVPLVLGVMLLWRLAPKGGWISRWPLAFFIGVFCGLRLIGYLHGDFLNQIRNAIVPLIMLDDAGQFDLWTSLRHFILIFGVLAAIVYFFFSIEHKGIVGKTARVGIWVLMITFGAGFGYTVMGRIALLAIRLEFIFDDWFWFIDPTGKRIAEAAETAAGLILHMTPMLA